MSNKSLMDLSKTLSRKCRIEILEKLCEKSCRNIELSKSLSIRKEKVSEALSDLVASRMVVLLEKGAIYSEQHTMYVGSPFGSEILNISKKLDSINEIKIMDLGDGIEYFLKYYLEADFKVNHKVKIIRDEFRIDIEIKGTPCEKKNCEITCEPVIKNIIKRFGNIGLFEKDLQANCSFKIKLNRK